jgi:hypothetical protein
LGEEYVIQDLIQNPLEPILLCDGAMLPKEHEGHTLRPHTASASSGDILPSYGGTCSCGKKVAIHHHFLHPVVKQPDHPYLHAKAVQLAGIAAQLRAEADRLAKLSGKELVT